MILVARRLAVPRESGCGVRVRRDAASRGDQPSNRSSQRIPLLFRPVRRARVHLLVAGNEVGIVLGEPAQVLLAHRGTKVEQDRRDMRSTRIDRRAHRREEKWEGSECVPRLLRRRTHPGRDRVQAPRDVRVPQRLP